MAAVFAPQPYQSRRVSFRGILELDAWRIKQYSIVFDDLAPDWSLFEAGIAAARRGDLWLPEPAITLSRPGLAFLIGHQGRSCEYMVLKWWDNENELPGRVLIADRTANGRPQPGLWRPAHQHEGACVWDLAVIWFERNAYIQTVLSGRTSEDYLAQVYTGPA